jgi:hypothetical protein
MSKKNTLIKNLESVGILGSDFVSNSINWVLQRNTHTEQDISTLACYAKQNICIWSW